MTPNKFELIELALLEAKKAGRSTKPNPRVGAVLLSKKGELIKGFHQKAGHAHAEINVFEECKKQGVETQGATMAVTLEPCCYQGRTGACSKAVVEAGIAEVIVGIQDPNPKVSGKGIEALKKAGIKVHESVMAKECFELNREWMLAHRLGRPFITLKMATSLDGKWAAEDGNSKWITGDQSRNRAHQLRARVDAIATTFATIEKDNPSMTARPDDEKLEEQPKLFIFSSQKPKDLNQLNVEKRNPVWIDTSKGLEPALMSLHKEHEVSDLMIEAGPTLTTAFLEADLFDEIYLFQAPILLGGKAMSLGVLNKGALPGKTLRLLHNEQLGKDQFMILARG